MQVLCTNVDGFSRFAINSKQDTAEVVLMTTKKGDSVSLIGRKVESTKMSGKEKAAAQAANQLVRQRFVTALKGDARFSGLDEKIEKLVYGSNGLDDDQGEKPQQDRRSLPLTTREIKSVLNELATDKGADFKKMISDVNRFLEKPNTQQLETDAFKDVFAFNEQPKGADSWVEIVDTRAFANEDVNLLDAVLTSDQKNAFKTFYGRALAGDSLGVRNQWSHFKDLVKTVRAEMSWVKDLNQILRAPMNGRDVFKGLVEDLLTSEHADTHFGSGDFVRAAKESKTSPARKFLETAMKGLRDQLESEWRNPNNLSATVARSQYALFKDALAQAERMYEAYGAVKTMVGEKVESLISVGNEDPNKKLDPEKENQLRSYAEGLVEHELETFSNLTDANLAEGYFNASEDSEQTKRLVRQLETAADRLTKTDEEIVNGFKDELKSMLQGDNGLVFTFKQTVQTAFGQEMYGREFDTDDHFDMNGDGVVNIFNDLFKESCEGLRASLKGGLALSVDEAKAKVKNSLMDDFNAMRVLTSRAGENLREAGYRVKDDFAGTMRSELGKDLVCTQKGLNRLIKQFLDSQARSSQYGKLVSSFLGKFLSNVYAPVGGSVDTFKKEFKELLEQSFADLKKNILSNRSSLDKVLQQAQYDFWDSLTGDPTFIKKNGLGYDTGDKTGDETAAERMITWRGEVRALIDELKNEALEANLADFSKFDPEAAKQKALEKLNAKFAEIKQAQEQAFQDSLLAPQPAKKPVEQGAMAPDEAKAVKKPVTVSVEEKLASFNAAKGELAENIRSLVQRVMWSKQMPVNPELQNVVRNGLVGFLEKYVDSVGKSIESEKTADDSKRLPPFDIEALENQMEKLAKEYWSAGVQKVGAFVTALDGALKEKGVDAFVNLTGTHGKGSAKIPDEDQTDSLLAPTVFAAAVRCITERILPRGNENDSPAPEKLANDLVAESDFLDNAIKGEMDYRRSSVQKTIDELMPKIAKDLDAKYGDTNVKEMMTSVLNDFAKQYFDGIVPYQGMENLRSALTTFADGAVKRLNDFQTAYQTTFDALLREKEVALPSDRANDKDVKDAIATCLTTVMRSKNRLATFAQVFSDEEAKESATTTVAGLAQLIEGLRDRTMDPKNLTSVVQDKMENDWFTGRFLERLPNDKSYQNAPKIFAALPEPAKKAIAQQLLRNVRQEYDKKRGVGAVEKPITKGDLDVIIQTAEKQMATVIHAYVKTVLDKCTGALSSANLVAKDDVPSIMNPGMPYSNLIMAELRQLLSNPQAYAKAHVGILRTTTSAGFEGTVNLMMKMTSAPKKYGEVFRSSMLALLERNLSETGIVKKLEAIGLIENPDLAIVNVLLDIPNTKDLERVLDLAQAFKPIGTQDLFVSLYLHREELANLKSPFKEADILQILFPDATKEEIAEEVNSHGKSSAFVEIRARIVERAISELLADGKRTFEDMLGGDDQDLAHKCVRLRNSLLNVFGGKVRIADLKKMMREKDYKGPLVLSARGNALSRANAAWARFQEALILDLKRNTPDITIAYSDDDRFISGDYEPDQDNEEVRTADAKKVCDSLSKLCGGNSAQMMSMMNCLSQTDRHDGMVFSALLGVNPEDVTEARYLGKMRDGSVIEVLVGGTEPGEHSDSEEGRGGYKIVRLFNVDGSVRLLEEQFTDAPTTEFYGTSDPELSEYDKYLADSDVLSPV